MNTDAGALLKLAELLKRLEQCRDSRPLVYALDHTETFTVGDLRQAASHVSQSPAQNAAYDKAEAAAKCKRAILDRLKSLSVPSGQPDAAAQASPEPLAKIRHRGIFIERQGTSGVYRYICHTGILKFLPDLYDTQADAIKAVDAKLDAASPVPSASRATPCDGADDLQHLDGMLDDRERGS